MNLRDHDKPCEHGNTRAHGWASCEAKRSTLITTKPLSMSDVKPTSSLAS